MSTAILYSLIAGVVGTLGGGVIAAILRRNSGKIIGFLMSFAAGFMLAIVCFDLIPEAWEGGGNLSTVLIGISLGVMLVVLLDAFVDAATGKAKKLKENAHSSDAMYKIGVIMTIAIAIHNFPEGLAIGASTASIEQNGGAMVSLLICVHNIPEGLAMTAPLIASGMKTWKALLLCGLSGTPTVLGAVVGRFAGGISPMIVAGCLALAAGAMLYIIFGEMLPSAFRQTNAKSAAFMVAISMMAGFTLISLL